MVYTANILTAKNTTFRGVMISSVHTPTVLLASNYCPKLIKGTAVVFLEIFLFIIQTVVCRVDQCTNT